jgi:cytochrome d ubiquinol oxidase subunit II
MLYGRLTGRALPLVAVAVAAGIASLALAWPSRPARLDGLRLGALRVTAATAVAAVLWAWAAAQYPDLLLPGLTVRAGAAPRATLVAVVICAAVGGALLIPSLAWLLALVQRPPRPAGAATLEAPRQRS